MEETKKTSLNTECILSDDFPLLASPDEKLNIWTHDFLPFLRSEGTWSNELVSQLYALESGGFQGIAFRPGPKGKISFFATSTSIKRDILHLLLPVYVGSSISGETVTHLPSSFIPLELVSTHLEKLKGTLQTYKCLFFYSPNCGSAIEDTHTRLLMAHFNSTAVINWLWDILGCFELVLVDTRITTEEDHERLLEVTQEDRDTLSPADLEALEISVRVHNNYRNRVFVPLKSKRQLRGAKYAQ